MTTKSAFLSAAAIGLLTCCSGKVLAQAKHDATGFECSFISDKFKGGKSGVASCSYDGEKVYALPSEHCKTRRTGAYIDMVNFRVDLKANKITWEDQSGHAPFYQPEAIEMYMGKPDNMSREQATEYVKKLITIPNDLGIFHTERVYVYTPTEGELDRRKENLPAYLITFGLFGYPYTLFIYAEGTAILSEYHYRSVVDLRFGTCRKLTK
jgi:hypothetical protein